jgi:hypothetical protein
MCCRRVTSFRMGTAGPLTARKTAHDRHELHRKAQRGRNGNYKHGRSAKVIATRRWVREKIREVRALTRSLETSGDHCEALSPAKPFCQCPMALTDPPHQVYSGPFPAGDRMHFPSMEKARVYHAARRRGGCVAARGARAAGGPTGAGVGTLQQVNRTPRPYPTSPIRWRRLRREPGAGLAATSSDLPPSNST